MSRTTGIKTLAAHDLLDLGIAQSTLQNDITLVFVLSRNCRCHFASCRLLFMATADTAEQTNKPKRVHVRVDIAAMSAGDRVGLRRHVMEHKVRYDLEAKGGAASPGAFAPMTDAAYMEKFGHVEHLALYFSTVLDKAAAGAMVVEWVRGWDGAGGYRVVDEGAGVVRVEPAGGLA